MRLLFTPILFLFCVVASASAISQETTLAPIVISDSSKKDKADTASLHITTDSYKNRIVTLPEVLSEQSGLHLTRYGGLDESTALSVRGSASNEVGVYLDGIPLQTANGLGVNLTPINFDDVKSIAVYKNGSQTDEGFVPQTGVVWIETKNIPGETHYGASIDYGSFNTLKVQATFSKKWKRFGMMLSNAFHHTDGNFKFFDSNGTPANLNDDRTISRINNEASIFQPLLKFHYAFDDKTEVTLINRFVYQENGIPGIATNQSKNASLTQIDNVFGLRVNRKDFFVNHLNFSNLFYNRYYQSEYQDKNAEIGLGRAQDNHDKTLVFGNKMMFDYFGFKKQALQAFVLYQAETFSPRNDLATPREGTRSLRHQVNIGVTDTISLFRERLKLTPHLSLVNTFNRLNNSDPSLPTPGGYENAKNQHNWAGAFGVGYKMVKGLTLEGHVARVLRYPTFTELFGDRGGFLGNPFLKPQTSHEWDAGLVFKRGPIFMRTAYFERYVDELIQFQLGSGVIKAENVGAATVKGAELQASVTLVKGLNLGGNYTYQKATDHGNYEGRTLVGRPQHEINVKADYQYKKISPYISYNFLDANFLDPLNTRVVSHRSFVNAGVSYEATENVVLSFEAKNLSDDQVVDVVGFPLPGRSFFAKLSFKK